MDEARLTELLERGGSAPGSGRPAKYNGMADPAAAEELAGELARRLRAATPSAVVVWEDPEDVVLGHVVGRELGLPVVRAYDADGLVGHTAGLPAAPRIALVADAVRDPRVVLAARALADHERGLPGVTLEPAARAALIAAADGDARVALTGLETAAALAGRSAVGPDHVRAALAQPHLRYDKAGDAHYDQISAFIKSLRGSDPDAALYWLVRMLETGEDPRFLARRMVVVASEDVGLADPTALGVAVAGFQALERVGLPEARFALAQTCLYLALAPKSNSLARALGRAGAAVAELGNAPVPAHLRDASYRAAARLGHGVGYRYPHDDPTGWVAQQYGPDGLRALYEPGDHGAEPDLQAWRRSRE